MMNPALACAAGLGLLLCGICSVGDSNQKAKETVLALQSVLQEAIKTAEPSITCILVSRSDGFARYGGANLNAPPGKLGSFDPEALDDNLARLGFSREKREQIIQSLDLANPENIPQAYGTGIVVDSSGLILTNYHVVHDATKVFVRLSGQRGSYADIYAADPRSDLALLKLLDENISVQPLTFGDADKAKRGQFVVVLSHPYAAGFRDGNASASTGIISNIRRFAPSNAQEDERDRMLHHYGTLLQTDVRLHYGCSGGALLNLEGELLGVTTSAAAIQGTDVPGGFAIPMNEGIKRIVQVLRRGHEVEYGFLGVGFERTKNQRNGVALSYVTAGSPADKAGLHAGDVILAVNGQPTHNSDELFLAMSTMLAGTTIQLDVQKARSATRERVQVTLAKYYVRGQTIAANSQRPFFRGIRVDYTSLVVQRSYPGTRQDVIPPGVLITEVQPNSSAATTLLKPGEVITHVNGRAVNRPSEFYQIVANVTGPVELTLLNTDPGRPAPKITLN